jgi:hypothetical protein
VEQPPGERQIFAVGIKIVTISVFVTIVFVVLELYFGALLGRRRQRNDAGEIVSASQKVELDACEESEEGEGIYQSESTRNS